jgi:predicted DCC family thiol-disulfide oxidoreductase YuxK
MVRTKVLYDGDCGLCQGTVRFLRQADRRGELEFEAQGEPGASVVVRTPDGRVLERSEAVLFALSRVGLPWSGVAALGRLAPRRLADAIYAVVARNRHNLLCRRE